MARKYGQYCGLARALDVVGDRWNLLIVRQLLIGPARYRDLQDGLPGIATNLLSDRLRDLEAAGVVERRLGEERNAVLYALTEWGAALREPVEGLIRWSLPLMITGPGEDVFLPQWLPVAIPAIVYRGGAPAGPEVVGVEIDGQLYQVSAVDDGVDVRPHDGRDLDAILRGTPEYVLGFAAGLSLDDIRAVTDIEGDEAALLKVFRG
ncbi:helix-turn-helix domain-containing protein [Tsukamurella sp. 8F]|uniref:winged helix-turn-helix transcriptional regulator n=1 Tax=unclassified Tsukamurella TaxID=2633480 RepID=UPI0023B8D5BE|nr:MULTISPECIES: helix-turn-helix domain-containing protein [unclassified Tsukamurella]MDF0529434.1 helix-turn-helix domain-containing protein [Tsukamurella sp. 8J]MDF0589343.1 helix-turn-helix domain-containing protein [Tsukamurella sp. 8F]